MGVRYRNTLMIWRRRRGRMGDECGAVAVFSWGSDTFGRVVGRCVKIWGRCKGEEWGRETEDDDDEQEDFSEAKAVDGESTKLRRMRQWRQIL
jgi:hypothetical protein